MDIEGGPQLEQTVRMRQQWPSLALASALLLAQQVWTDLPPWSRVTLLAVPVSLWWMAMLIVQGRYGAEVLPYSESLADVSFTATAPEVWRDPTQATPAMPKPRTVVSPVNSQAQTTSPPR